MKKSQESKFWKKLRQPFARAILTRKSMCNMRLRVEFSYPLRTSSLNQVTSNLNSPKNPISHPMFHLTLKLRTLSINFSKMKYPPLLSLSVLV